MQLSHFCFLELKNISAVVLENICYWDEHIEQERSPGKKIKLLILTAVGHKRICMFDPGTDRCNLS